LGLKLGQEAKGIFSDYIMTCHHFTKLLPWRESDWLSSIDKQIQLHFPHIYQELQGLSDGCEQNYKDILLWNCRGDLLSAVPDGCTSIGAKKSSKAIIAHNEDGDPNLNGHCFLLNAQLESGVRIFAFAYPGSIPGHTICANSHGLAYTVNNLRLTEQGTGLPRMVISRALLECKDSEEFIALLKNHNRSGGFHYTVADTATLKPKSVEAPFHDVSVVKIDRVAVHANHLVHEQTSKIAQIITRSSKDRQFKMSALTSDNASKIDELRCFDILQDIDEQLLPIFRTEPDDPDEENTLATAIITLDETGVSLTIYGMEQASQPKEKKFFICEHTTLC
jgi:predicted choloylglycine hydrolase